MTKRKELIEKVMDDIKINLVDYEEFVLSCVEQVVSKWTLKELESWGSPE